MAKLLRFTIRVGIICISLFAIVRRSLANKDNLVCTTQECKKLGDYYLKNMNQHGSPCTDFSDYVCHNWLQQNPKPSDFLTWAVEDAIAMRQIVDIKTLLEDPQFTAGGRQVEQAKKLYKSCMLLPHMERAEPQVIKSIMTKIGNWPMFFPRGKEIPPTVSWSSIDDEYIKITGRSALFDNSLMVNLLNAKEIIMQFRSLYSAYGTLKRSDEWKLDMSLRNHYKTFLYKLIETVGPVNPTPFKNAIDLDLNHVIKFREQLAEISKPNSKDTYSVYSVAEFERWYSNAVTQQASAKVNWFAKLIATYKNGRDAHGNVVNQKTTINVNVDYITKLGTLLAKTPKRVVVNHIHLYFAEMHVKLTPDMKSELKQSVDVIDYPKNKFRPEHSRWEWCVRGHNMKSTLAKMFIAAHLPRQNRAVVENLFDKAKVQLEELIGQSTWLSKKMKERTIRKAKGIERTIGYTDRFLSFEHSAERDENDIDPLTLDMYYSTKTDRFYATASYLQPPIFTPNVPYVIHHGATMSSIGHELHHAFGKTGIKFDKTGKRFLWDEETQDKYEERTKCFEDQYDKYAIEEYKMYRILMPKEVVSTVEEDISDVMGLRLAYNEFQKELARQNGTCAVLPGFENMGCEKLFFIAFANTFCGYSEPGIVQQLLIKDEHSSSRVRINGAVANIKEFSAAFNCKLDDRLNLKKRCDLWKD